MAAPGGPGERPGGPGEHPEAIGERIVVGHVKAPHGVRGAVKVESLTDDPSRFAPGSVLGREGDPLPLTVRDATTTPAGLLIRFDEVATREEAEALRGTYLEAPAPPRRRGRYLWHEVVGIRVRDVRGDEVGTVREIMRAGGGEVAVVDSPEGELLVPLVRAFVPRFAPRRGVMVVDVDRIRSGPADVQGPAGVTVRRTATKRLRAPTLEIDVVTLFPKMLEGPFAESIPGRVQAEGIATIRLHDLRRWGLGRHRSVDDYTFGGGAGMVLRPEPVVAALDALRRPASTVVLLDAGGERFDQAMAGELSRAGHLVIVCGRYEGVDERIRGFVDREVSVGDVVLSGGEPAAIVVIDAVLRLLPGAIESESVADESFSTGLLEYPQFTRPREFRGRTVPDVLVSGDHAAVEAWRLRESLRRTLGRRPDLLGARSLGPREREILAELALEEGEPAAGALSPTRPRSKRRAGRDV